MVGLVIVTHGKLGETLMDTAEHIMGRKENHIALVSVAWNDPLERIETRIRTAFQSVMSEDGVIVATDMFGGTPSNVSLAFVGEAPIAVVTGINLPMVLAFLNHRDRYTYEEMVHYMKKRGVESIVSSLDVLPDIHVLSGHIVSGEKNSA